MRAGFAGVVARKSDGSFLAACRYRITATSAALAEAKAILHGCELGIFRGWHSVIIESDSSDSIAGLRNTPALGS